MPLRVKNVSAQSIIVFMVTLALCLALISAKHGWHWG